MIDCMVTIKLPEGEWRFDPQQRLGAAGGFGEVFAGVGADGSPVAVKRLHVTADQAAHRELQIASRLRSRDLKHIVPILDAGQDAESDRYFIVMARAERNLEDEVTARGPLSVAESIDVLAQIGDGLIEAADIVHRDLKPGNVLLHEGRWKIADFGIARFVEEATSLNTLRDFLSAAYASPEQWLGERATAATDVYALGCIAHALMTGAPPFPGPQLTDFQQQHLRTTPPALPAGDPRVSSLVSSMLRKAPDGRPSTARIVSVLRSVIATPVGAVSPVAAGLQQVASIEADLRAKREAEAARARAELERRQRLAVDGIEGFRDLTENILGVIRDAEPSIDVVRQGRRTSVKLGSASLTLDLAQGDAMPADSMPNSKWDPVVAGAIDVRQDTRDKWSHGATLWYMRLPNRTEYRWYEVAYKDNAFASRVLRGPYAAQKLEDADHAAGPGMHTVEIQSGPTAIDGEDVQTFVDRWLDRLIKAYHGRLRPF
jgi:eukaryotic-like serine/threonine-protein kinase